MRFRSLIGTIERMPPDASDASEKRLAAARSPNPSASRPSTIRESAARRGLTGGGLSGPLRRNPPRCLPPPVARRRDGHDGSVAFLLYHLRKARSPTRDSRGAAPLRAAPVPATAPPSSSAEAPSSAAARGRSFLRLGPWRARSPRAGSRLDASPSPTSVRRLLRWGRGRRLVSTADAAVGINTVGISIVGVPTVGIPAVGGPAVGRPAIGRPAVGVRDPSAVAEMPPAVPIATDDGEGAWVLHQDESGYPYFWNQALQVSRFVSGCARAVYVRAWTLAVGTSSSTMDFDTLPRTVPIGWSSAHSSWIHPCRKVVIRPTVTAGFYRQGEAHYRALPAQLFDSAVTLRDVVGVPREPRLPSFGSKLRQEVQFWA